jgi:hypothetical protein
MVKYGFAIISGDKWHEADVFCYRLSSREAKY